VREKKGGREGRRREKEEDRQEEMGIRRKRVEEGVR
jgi:hypothetical protein